MSQTTNTTTNITTLKEPIFGFKGFKKQQDGSLKCRNLTYKIGVQIYMPIEPKLCFVGMHFCRTLKEVFDHYSPLEPDNVYYHICAEGNAAIGDDKIAVDTLTVLEQVTEEEMLEAFLHDSLAQVREIQKENPDVVISGSVALLMMGLIKPRFIHDLDLTLNAFSDFNGKAEVIAGGGGSGNDCIKINFDSSINFDLFINPKLIYKSVEYMGHVYKISDPRPILEAKWKYFLKGKTKHGADIIQILQKNIMENNMTTLVPNSENIMYTGFNNLKRFNKDKGLPKVSICSVDDF